MTKENAEKVAFWLLTKSDVKTGGTITDKHSLLVSGAKNGEAMGESFGGWGFTTPCSIPLFILSKMEKELGISLVVAPNVSEQGYVANLILL